MKTFKTTFSFSLVVAFLLAPSSNSWAQTKTDQQKNQWYDIANGVWSWHKKNDEGSLLIVKPNLAPIAPTSFTSGPSGVNSNKVVPTPTNDPLLAPPSLQVQEDSSPQAPNTADNNQANTDQDNSALTSQLPNYTTDKSVTKDYIENVKSNISNKILNQQEARAADPQLPKKPSKVAYLPTKKEFLLPATDSQLIAVDKLNIGQEAKLNKNDLIGESIKDLSIEYKTPDRLKSPKKISRTLISDAINFQTKVGKVKKLRGKSWDLGKVVQITEVENIKYSIANQNNFETLPVDPLSKYDVFLLSAIILNDKKIYPPALGLFDEVTKSEKHRQEASFYMGEIAYKLKLYSEAAHRLIPIVLKPNEFRSEAMGILLKDFPKEHESKIALSLSKMEDKETLPPQFMNKIFYYISKHEFDSGKYAAAKLSADQVSLKSDFYVKARFIKGLSEYFDDDLNASMGTLTQLQSFLKDSRKTDKNIDSLVALNLGRIYFQLKQYKSSYHSYKKIDKSHPLWLQAVTELGWVQLALGDQFGAIGNMYSLHSPYFKAIYKPETYAIKTIGYLNICQYADAYKSLSLHEKDYRGWKTKIDNYVANYTTPAQVYQTVSKYLGGNSSKDVDGLPYQVIREVARQKTFLNIQKNINSKVDESKSYSKALSQFSLDSKKVKKKLTTSKQSLKNTQKAIAVSEKTNQTEQLASQKAELDKLKEYITSYYFQLRLFDHSRKKLNQLKINTQARIKKENKALTRLAGQKLLDHIRYVKKDNDSLLDNNELLRYEVFSGSGENIRYQVTGGKIKNENRIPASVKPKKSLNWDFSGEYWEDEIGSYRTTLVDKCPKN